MAPAPEKQRDFVQRLLVLLAANILIVVLVVPATAQDAPRSRNRGEAVTIVADLRRIVKPKGLETTEAVRIGGIDRWVSVRSWDLRKPVLLILHGRAGLGQHARGPVHHPRLGRMLHRHSLRSAGRR